MNDDLKNKIEKLYLFFGEEILSIGPDDILSDNIAIRRLKNPDQISFSIRERCGKSEIRIKNSKNPHEIYTLFKWAIYGINPDEFLDILKSVLFEIHG